MIFIYEYFSIKSYVEEIHKNRLTDENLMIFSHIMKNWCLLNSSSTSQL